MFPDGGSTGQFLAKASGVTADVEWVDLEQATEETAGISRNASQAKVDAGEDDEDFVTPLKLSTKLASAIFGSGQTWQDMRSQRAVNTAYTNTTGKPIVVSAGIDGSPTAPNYVSFKIDGLLVNELALHAGELSVGTDETIGLVTIVPPGSTYFLSTVNPTPTTLSFWAELR